MLPNVTMHQPNSNNDHNQPPPYFPPPPPPPMAMLQPPLPIGWEEAVDPVTSRPYFANRSTGETTWERPSCFIHPPPPQQPHCALMPLAPLQYHHPMAVPGVATQNMQTQLNHTQMMHTMEAPQVVDPQNMILGVVPMANHNLNLVQANTLFASTHNIMSMLPNNNIHAQTQSGAQYIEAVSSNVPQQQPQFPLTNNTFINNSLPPSSSTTTAGVFLVPTVRAMIEAEHAKHFMKQENHQNDDDENNEGEDRNRPKLELAGLTAGAIADLVNITRELKARNVNGGDFADGEDSKNVSGSKEHGTGEEEEVDQYYIPLQPFSLPISAIPPRIEPGRVAIRLHALHSKLGKIMQ